MSHVTPLLQTALSRRPASVPETGFLGFRVNMTILAGKMQGNQGAPRQVSTSGCLF